MPQIAYGKVLTQLSAREHVLETDRKENEVRAIFRQRAQSYQARIDGLPGSWEQGRLAPSASSTVCASVIPRCSTSATRGAT